MKRTLGLFAGAIVAALLSACGNPTPITSGTPAPATPFPPQVASEYPLLTAGAQVSGVSKGADGGVWFTETAANKIGRLSSTAVVTEFPLPVPGLMPFMITNGPNGELWFTESGTNQIGFLSISGASYGYLSLPNTLARPWGIVTGPDGNLWVTDPVASQVISINPSSSVATSYQLPVGANPTAISLGPNGQVWFLEPGVDSVGAIAPGQSPSAAISQFPVTAGAGLGVIVPGPDGAVWFTETKADKLGRMLANGTLTETSLSPMVKPFGLAADANGNFEIGDQTASTIATYAIGTGKVTTYPTITASAGVYWVTLGADNEIYFSEQTVNKIGQFRYF